MRQRTNTIGLLIATVLSFACEAPEKETAYEYIDLSYAFDETTIYWPTAQHFKHDTVFYGWTEGGYFYSSFNIRGSEHGGTHMDAPIHFAEGRKTVSDLTLDDLIGPGVVIHIREKCAADRDYRLMVEDIEAWESVNGQIPDGAIVIGYTGWQERWPDRKRYLGSDEPGDVENLHFPGISKEAAEFLANQRNIRAVGLDTPSLDHGPSRDFIAHQILNGAEIFGLENLTNLDRLPPKGAAIFALPMKISGGSGAPTRVFARIERSR